MLSWQGACLIVIFLSAFLEARSHPIAVDKSYRKYVGKDQDPAWVNGNDVFSTLGYNMTLIQSGTLNAQVIAVSTLYGQLVIHGGSPFFKADLYQAYSLPTFWPYCQSLTKCVVYSQQSDTDPTEEIALELPPGVRAIDLFLDIAIDCQTVLGIVPACSATAYPGGTTINSQLKSFCGSPFVSSYYGFYNEDEDLKSILLKCGSPYARAIGLLRIGSKAAWSEQE